MKLHRRRFLTLGSLAVLGAASPHPLSFPQIAHSQTTENLETSAGSTGFYVFRLERIHVITPRGRVPDNDVVTFSVLVSQLDRGHGTGLFLAMGAGSSAPASAISPTNRKNIDLGWNIGPLELASGESIHVVYTGTNISDDQLSTLGTKEQDEIQLKILNAALTRLGGVVGDFIGDVIEDPLGGILGFKPAGPCNGTVFSDAVQFSGADLERLPMSPLPPPPPGDLETPLPPKWPGISFTHSYTDEATHDRKTCGDLAKTNVTFSVFRVPFVSVRSVLASRFPNADPTTGLRQLGRAGSTTSLKSLLGVRP